MGRLLHAVSFALVLTSCPLTVALGQTSKPVTREKRHVDYSGPPITTTIQLTSASDLVVVGQVTNSWYVPSSFFEIDTKFQVFPTDILKSDSHVSNSSALEVEVHGGAVDSGDHVRIVEYEGSPSLTVGDTYVMFLRWSDELGCYIYSLGAEGLFKVSPNGTIISLGNSTLARSKANTPLASFRAEIASLK